MPDGTLKYYSRNFKEFGAATFNVDFSSTQDRFLSLLPPKATILDFGCGSGRDSLYFLKKGFRVTATDGSPEMCRLASANTGQEVKHLLFQELDEENAFDGIWACASVLHLPKTELKDVFLRMEKSLKPNGILYVSFKYGSFEGVRSGRFFTDFTENEFRIFLSQNSKMKIIEYWITTDVRPERKDEKWLNLLIRKS